MTRMPAIAALALAKKINDEVLQQLGPPEEGVKALPNAVVPMSIVRHTRGYIERIANQVNGCYQNGWYDGCAILVRRLIETLIIESFEKHHITGNIKTGNGEFLYLRDLIDKCIQEPTWNLSRNCKKALPKLKDIGDKSAHSRRFIAQRFDVEPLIADIRLVVQELVYLAEL